MPLEQLTPTPVSRETRRLLAAAALALVVLWALARIRFPDRPRSPDPVSPILTQIAAPARFSDLALELNELQGRLTPTLTERTVSVPLDRAGQRVSVARPAWWLRDDLALVMVPADATAMRTAPTVNVNPALGFAVVRTNAPSTPPPLVWSPERLDRPRYVFAATTGAGAISLAPIFAGALESSASAVWRGDVWTVTPPVTLPFGAFVFTSAGEWMGAVADDATGRVIVPAATLMHEASSLIEHPGAGSGSLRLDVQPLTPALAAATGAASGVLVAWSPPDGATADIRPGDVIERVNGDPITSTRAWAARTATLSAGDPVTLGIRRDGAVLTIALMTPPVASPAPVPLGLTMQHGPLGSRVTRIAAGSAAARAGLQPEDVITFAGTARRPSPTQVRRAFSGEGAPLMIGVMRGTRHLVVTVDR